MHIMTCVSASLGLPLEFLQWSAPCHPKPNNESPYTGLCDVWLWQWAVSDTGLWHWASPGTPGFTAHGGDSALWFGPRAVPALPVPAKGSGGQTTECASSRWGYSTSSCPSCTSVKDSLLPRLLWGQWGTAVTSAPSDCHQRLSDTNGLSQSTWTKNHKQWRGKLSLQITKQIRFNNMSMNGSGWKDFSLCSLESMASQEKLPSLDIDLTQVCSGTFFQIFSALYWKSFMSQMVIWTEPHWNPSSPSPSLSLHQEWSRRCPGRQTLRFCKRQDHVSVKRPCK